MVFGGLNPFIDHPEFVESIWGNPTSVIETKKTEYKVYPNPVFEKLNIEVGDHPNLTYHLYNYGRIPVTKGILNHGNARLTIGHHPDGLYLLVVSDAESNTSEQFKLIKTSR